MPYCRTRQHQSAGVHALCNSHELPLRFTPIASEPILRVFLDPRRLLRWVYLGRAVVVTASNRASAGVYEDRSGKALADEVTWDRAIERLLS